MSSEKLGKAREVQGRLKEVFSHFLGKERGGQAFLVKKTGLGSGTINGWFNEEKPNLPDHASLLRVSEALGISYEWLATGKGSMLPEENLLKEKAAPYGRPAVRPGDWRAAVEHVDRALTARGISQEATEVQKDLLVSLLAQGEAAGTSREELQRQLDQLVDLVEASIRRAREGKLPNP